MIKLGLILVSLLFASTSYGKHHEETYRGMDLSKNFGIQFEVCTLRDGKSMASVDRINSKIASVMTEINAKGSVLRMKPFYAHGSTSNPGPDFIDLIVAPMDEIGAIWTDFLATDGGSKVFGEFQNAAKCHNKLAYGVPKLTKVDEMMSTDERVITLNWCTPKEGVSMAQLRAKHASWLAANQDAFKAASWSVLVPRQGAGTAQGRYAHMNVFTSLKQMFANEEWIANGGGNAGLSDYYSS
ncbi:MAG: hypothetical protein HN683_07000, partial [Gammaproteobacteria bacterium]|nr:hypothetical protein [Gammaproteobacteria bacterium]